LLGVAGPHKKVRFSRKDDFHHPIITINADGFFDFTFIYLYNREYSSVEEHPTADRNVPGLKPGAPLPVMVKNLKVYLKLKLKSNA
jgi:hypothetical protein